MTLRILAQGGVPVLDPNDPAVVWLDLCNPTLDEERAVETVCNRDVPTPAERSAMEESSRFFEDKGALYLTATLLGRREEGMFQSGPVTFLLSCGKLFTIRQINPRAFEIGEGRANARIGEAKNGADVFMALLESATERLADLLADLTRDTNELSHSLFSEESEPDARVTLRALGRVGALAALVHESLSSLQRMAAYTISVCARHDLTESRLLVYRRDSAELERVAEALQGRLAYLQDAALGLINAKQTDVLKTLSLATIAFVPATLIASVFGMNFQYIDWYHETWGPAAAFGLMVVAPVALFGVARWRGWF